MSRPTAIRILALASAIGLLGQAILTNQLFGLNLVLLSIALLAAGAAVRPRRARFDPLDAWLPIAAVAVVAGIALRADPLLDLLDIGAGCLLLGATIAAIGGLAVTRRSAAGVTALGIAALGWVGAGVLRVSAATRRPEPADPETIRRLPAWAGPVGRGLLLALPVLLVFAMLFASADAVFASFADRLLTWNVDLGELPVRLAVAFLVAWAAAGLLAIAAGDLARWEGKQDAPPAWQSLGAAAVTDPLRPGAFPILGSIEAATILVAVDVLFAIFVGFQFAYLFGGLDTLAASGLPYAQYARSGFFELVVVALLAGGLLVTVHAVARQRTSLLIGAGLVLCGLTAVVLASALLRLRIYHDAYGWTEFRFYVLASIVWLGAGIAIAAGLLVRNRMGWVLHGLAMAAIVVLVGINLVGPSRLIATENVARVLDPSRVPADGKSGLDVTYVRALGDDAVPALVAALPALDAADRAPLLAFLASRKQALAAPEATGWPAWNVGRETARRALDEMPSR